MEYKVSKKVEVDKMSDLDIISFVQAQFSKSGEKLSSAQCRFLLRLIDYGNTYGTESTDHRGVIIDLSEVEMQNKFGLSKSMITKCLTRYRKAGIIERIRDSENLRCSNTLILKEYYTK